MSNLLDRRPAQDLYQGSTITKETSPTVIQVETTTKPKLKLGLLLILAVPFILLFSAFGFALKLMNGFSGRNSL